MLSYLMLHRQCHICQSRYMPRPSWPGSRPWTRPQYPHHIWLPSWRQRNLHPTTDAISYVERLATWKKNPQQPISLIRISCCVRMWVWGMFVRSFVHRPRHVHLMGMTPYFHAICGMAFIYLACLVCSGSQAEPRGPEWQWTQFGQQNNSSQVHRSSQAKDDGMFFLMRSRSFSNITIPSRDV